MACKQVWMRRDVGLCAAALVIATSASTITFAHDWMPPKNRVAAEDMLARGEEMAFATAKIATARFYAEHILCKAAGLRDSIVDGADSVTALALEAF